MNIRSFLVSGLGFVCVFSGTQLVRAGETDCTTISRSCPMSIPEVANTMTFRGQQVQQTLRFDDPQDGEAESDLISFTLHGDATVKLQLSVEESDSEASYDVELWQTGAGEDVLITESESSDFIFIEDDLDAGDYVIAVQDAGSDSAAYTLVQRIDYHAERPMLETTNTTPIVEEDAAEIPTAVRDWWDRSSEDVFEADEIDPEAYDIGCYRFTDEEGEESFAPRLLDCDEPEVCATADDERVEMSLCLVDQVCCQSDDADPEFVSDEVCEDRGGDVVEDTACVETGPPHKAACCVSDDAPLMKGYLKAKDECTSPSLWMPMYDPIPPAAPEMYDCELPALPSSPSYGVTTQAQTVPLPTFTVLPPFTGPTQSSNPMSAAPTDVRSIDTNSTWIDSNGSIFSDATTLYMGANNSFASYTERFTLDPRTVAVEVNVTYSGIVDPEAMAWLVGLAHAESGVDVWLSDNSGLLPNGNVWQPIDISIAADVLIGSGASISKGTVGVSSMTLSSGRVETNSNTLQVNAGAYGRTIAVTPIVILSAARTSASIKITSIEVKQFAQ